jgi:hypothetical protein
MRVDLMPLQYRNSLYRAKPKTDSPEIDAPALLPAYGAAANKKKPQHPPPACLDTRYSGSPF